MYAAGHAKEDPDRPCIVMASTDETITYGEFDARTNRLAHLLRAYGLRDGDHYSILLENHPRFFEACGAGERAGLRYTAINSHLTAEEVGYILDDSAAKVLITSRQLRDVAVAALAHAPGVTLALLVDGPDDDIFRDYVEATSAYPSTPIADEKLGGPMLYSSGTTGRPKGILRAVPDTTPDKSAALAGFLIGIQRYRPGMVYLSPAPLYHSAPLGATGNTIRVGGTIIVMERFDPEQLLALVERHRATHIQMVPTMFSRLLKLPDDVKHRYDLSSLEYVVHAAAPCPVPVKEQMIEWWGPIIHEYYASTEGIGYTTCDAHEWLAHKGTVGRVALGVLRIFDEDFHECPPGVPGTIYFEPPGKLDYWNAPDKVRDNSTPDGSAITVGDVGFVDDEGWLFLTDRKTFMIISGGVNIYPQETENLLVTHPKVADVAVFGVPDVDLGEAVKAVVQPMPGIEPTPALAAELIGFCQEHLSKQKCPRTIDFAETLPRLPTGKLYKRLLRDAYWGDKTTRIV